MRQTNEDNRHSQDKKEKRGFERNERLDEIKADESEEKRGEKLRTKEKI